MKQVHLKPRQDHRIRNGHRWLFSNEIADHLKSYSPGEAVEILDAENHFIATGYINPHSLIAVRVLTSDRLEIGPAFFESRIRAAYERRRPFYENRPSYRLVFGESDGLPGLVIDRYESYFVIQSFTAGIDAHLDTIIQIIRDQFSPIAIVLRQDSAIRKLENVELSKRVVFGELPEVITVQVEGLSYRLDLLNGQKTGFFLDQKENHTYLKHFAAGKRVLDCFTHLGGWALNAARFGATEVTGLDISASAIVQCRENASLNALSSCTFREADVFDELKRLNEAKERFDIVILDPPAFAKSKGQAHEAIKGYREINRRAAKALIPGGYLFTCSCSQAVDPESFRNTVLQGIQSAGRDALLLEARPQPMDHPVLLSMRETEYLKCLVIQVL